MYISSVSQSQQSNHDLMEIESIQSPSHSESSNHDDLHMEGIYPSPPRSPSTCDQHADIVHPTSGPDSAAPGTPLRRENVYHNLIMTPPYTPPNQPQATCSTDFHTRSSSSSPILHSQPTDGARIYSPPILCSSRDNDGATMMSTGAISDSEKVYSEDDAAVIIELTKLLQDNSRKFYNVANLLNPGETEKLNILQSNGQVLHMHKILKQEFERWGRPLNLRRFIHFLNLECEEQMQFL